MSGDAEQEVIRERLRVLGLRFATAIAKRPDVWKDEGVWLARLPFCFATAKTDDPDHPAITDGRLICELPDQPAGTRMFLYDDEAARSARVGPIVRRMQDGWLAAIYRFRDRTSDRFHDFGLRDAKRISLLGALTFNVDFDGKEFGLAWSWDQPEESDALFNCRAWGWSLITSGLFAERTLLRHMELARDYLEARELLAPSDAAVAPRKLEEPPPTPLILQDTELRVLQAIREWNAEGRGPLLKDLVGLAKVSEQSTVSRALDRLKELGFEIENRRGGSGYWILRAPPGAP